MRFGAAWVLWKQMNAKAFNRSEQVKGYRELARAILDDIYDWHSASVGVGGLDHFVRGHV